MKSKHDGSIELNDKVRLKDAHIDFIHILSDMPGVSHRMMVSCSSDCTS